MLATGLFHAVLGRDPGVVPDSTIYLDVARHLRDGVGFATRSGPLVHFPPLYPLTLALVGPGRGAALGWVGWVQSLLAVLTAAMVGLAVWAGSPRAVRKGAASWAVAAFGSTGAFFFLFSVVRSEALFLPLALLAYVAIARFLATERRWVLVVAGAAAALACLTRYAGVALLPPLVVALLVRGGRPWARRLGESAVFTVLSVAPLAVWLARNEVVAASTTNRSLVVHPPLPRHGAQLAEAVASFVFGLPGHASPSRVVVATLVLGAVMGVAAVAWWRRVRSASAGAGDGAATAWAPAMGWLAGGFVLFYPAFLLVSISLFDAATPLDLRILAPLGVFLTVWAAVALTPTGGAGWSRRWKVLAWALAALLVFRGVRTAADVRWFHRQGLGFTAEAWVASPTVRAVAGAPPGVEILSHAADGIHFLTGRDARFLPERLDPLSLEPRRDFGRDLDGVCRALSEGRAWVVFFAAEDRPNYARREEVAARCTGAVAADMGDGVVFRAP